MPKTALRLWPSTGRLGARHCLPLLTLCLLGMQCAGQSTRTVACAAFSEAGSLATGTIRQGELEIHLPGSGVSGITEKIQVGNSFGCQQAFNKGGAWLVTVVAGDKLTVVVSEQTGATHRVFFSDWHAGSKYFEPAYGSPILAGFLEDDSLVLWRYNAQNNDGTAATSNISLYLQRWNVEGELLSDQDLGVTDSGINGRGPLVAEDLHRLWIPGGCGERCYRGIRFEKGQVKADASLTVPKKTASHVIDVRRENSFLSVLGDGTNQKAVLLDYSGTVTFSVELPFFPNLLGPLVPDWFYVRQVSASPDGHYAAIGRTRVAWVLVDTDRDWGSEVVLLTTHPFGVVSTIKTGQGGIGALAVDHRNNVVRLVGFWKDRWHDLRLDESSTNGKSSSFRRRTNSP